MVCNRMDYSILSAVVSGRCVVRIDRRREIDDVRHWNSPFGNTSVISEEKRIVFGLRTLCAKGFCEVYAVLHTNYCNAHGKPLVWRDLKLWCS